MITVEVIVYEDGDELKRKTLRYEEATRVQLPEYVADIMEDVGEFIEGYELPDVPGHAEVSLEEAMDIHRRRGATENELGSKQ